jgi:glutamyl-Q tRNA(Asp) synthetase
MLDAATPHTMSLVSPRPDLSVLASRLPPAPRTRFAPAPTGLLHLGHVVNAICVWGLARALGGTVLLRIEDHDRQRSRPEYERALLDDLDWLGFEPDVHATAAFRRGPCQGRQRDREHVYRAAIERLVALGLVYGCACSRRQIGKADEEEGSEELRYPGTCRDRGLPLEPGLSWRLRLAEGSVRFDDGLAGPQTQHPARQCGDLLLRDRLGNWTYQFAVAVDDAAQDVTLVVRGLDLIASTGRQIMVARLLGREAPSVFVHHPLVMKSVTAKLSKSDGDTGVADLRAAGWSAPQVIGEAASRIGFLDRPVPLAAADVAGIFTP